MLESARIMRRYGDEVNGRHDRITRLLFATLAVVFLATAISCDASERRADRLWRQAQERVQKNDTPGAIGLMQKIIDDYPDTPVAARARDQIVVYRGLQSAVDSYPSRRARELMVQVARAVEAYRHANRKPPAALDSLPSSAAEIPADPWGRPFGYELRGIGYRLRCFGADGAPGGEGDAADLLVVNGEFVAAEP